MIFGEFGTNPVTLPTTYQAGLVPGLTIDGVTLDVLLTKLGVTPDENFTVQNTGTGRVRVVWPAVQRSGTVDAKVAGVDKDTLQRIEFLCGRAGEHTVVYDGSVFSTNFISTSPVVSDEQGLSFDVDLEFYGKLPPVNPPPGYGSQLIPDVRSSQLDDFLQDAFDAGIGTLLLTRSGRWFFQRGEVIEPLGTLPLTNAQVTVRDDRTVLLAGLEANVLVVCTARNARLVELRRFTLPAGTQSWRLGAQSVEYLTLSGTTVQARSVNIASGLTTRAPWQTGAALAVGATTAAFTDAGVLLTGAVTEIHAGAVPVYVAPAEAAGTLFMTRTPGGVLLGTQDSGMIAVERRAHWDEALGVWMIGDITARYPCATASLGRQAGLFTSGGPSPWRVDAQGLSVAQRGFQTPFFYPGVIKLVGEKVLTPYGLYRSVK